MIYARRVHQSDSSLLAREPLGASGCWRRRYATDVGDGASLLRGSSCVFEGIELRTLSFLGLENKQARMASQQRNSSHGRLLRLVAVVAAGVLQLHLSLAMELHHHEPGASASLPQTVRAASQSSSGANAPCLACQIARQGSVNAPARGATVLQLPDARSLSSACPVKFTGLPKSRPSGRGPPLFS
jgi:hypothetical protein